MITINPGTEPINNSNEKNAINNIKHFLVDCNLDIEFERNSSDDYGDGWYCFTIKIENKIIEIQMPGLALHKVRYISDEQNVWDYPRLYIDDSSWLWYIAVDIVKDIIAGKED